MKLISVQSRGNRLVRIELLDSRFFPSRAYLYQLKKRDFKRWKRRAYAITMLKHESTALKAAETWLEGATI